MYSMQKNTHAGSVEQKGRWMFWILLPATCLILFDEWVKYLALQRLPLEGDLLDPEIIDFAIHKNFGVAFDIPFKMPLIIFVSVVIGIALLRIVQKHWNKDPMISFSSLLIVVAALGNLYDRVVYGYTVDYIILFGRSAINLSDLLIVTGVILLLFSSRKKKQREHPDQIDNMEKKS